MNRQETAIAPLSQEKEIEKKKKKSVALSWAERMGWQNQSQ